VYALDNFPSLFSLIQHYKRDVAEASADSHECIVICAGDFLSPSLLSSLDKGYGMVDILQHIGCDYVCLGNHENDVGDKALTQRILQCSTTSNTTTTSNTSTTTDNKHTKPIIWINSNVPELNEKLNVQTCEYATLTLPNSTIKVALMGLLTEDPSLYRPGAFGGATIEPLLKTAKQLHAKLKRTHDTVLAMTHQGIEQDRIMACEFGNTIPLIMGGHDHEPYLETHHHHHHNNNNNNDNDDDQCQIVKSGMDAQYAAIIDLTWSNKNVTNTNVPTIQVQLVDTAKFPKNQDIQKRVDQHQAILKELDAAQLFAVADWTTPTVGNSTGTATPSFSTKDNRLGPSTGTTAICSMIRMGMRCEVCLLNAGSVRCGREYPKDHQFTWADLKSEMPYPTKMVACLVPGSVLQETLQYSRRYATQNIAKGGYLHTSRTTICHDDGTIESVLGKPFDPHKQYMTCFPYGMLEGIDDQKPFLEWANKTTTTTQSMTNESSNILPNDHVGIPAKFIIVQVLSTLLWLKLGKFADIDTGKTGVIEKQELQARLEQVYGKAMATLMVENIFSVADMNQSGTISALEQIIISFAAKDMLNHIETENELKVLAEVAKEVNGAPTVSSNKGQDGTDYEQLAKRIKDILDIKGTGKIERDEIIQILGRVHREDLLE